MKRTTFILVVSMLCASLLFAAHASATVIRAFSLEERCALAGSIVVGTVVDKYERPTQSGHAFTYYVFKVSEVLKGGEKPGNQITFRHYGGKVNDDISVDIAGMPVLRKGKTYMLFFDPNTAAHCPFFGWHQGIFEIKDNGAVVTYEGRAVDVEDRQLKNSEAPLSKYRFTAKIAAVIKAADGKTADNFSQELKERENRRRKGPSRGVIVVTPQEYERLLRKGVSKQ